MKLWGCSCRRETARRPPAKGGFAAEAIEWGGSGGVGWGGGSMGLMPDRNNNVRKCGREKYEAKEEKQKTVTYLEEGTCAS